MRDPWNGGMRSLRSRRCVSPDSTSNDPDPTSGAMAFEPNGSKRSGSAAKISWISAGSAVSTTVPLTTFNVKGSP